MYILVVHVYELFVQCLYSSFCIQANYTLVFSALVI